MSDSNPEVDARDIYYTRCVAFAGFMVLIWDHCITFDDEVNLIWNGSKGALVYLFLLNRYLTPLGFIVNLVAFMLPSWGTETCNHFVKYEGAMTTIGIQIVGLMMFLRVRAMYKGNKLIVWGMACLFLVWVGVNAWLLFHGEAVPHVSGIPSCSMIFDNSVSGISPASAWLPLLYDTAVFVLTLNKTLPSIRQRQAGHIVYTLLEDGLVYYSLICAVNLVLVVMISRAPPSVQNIAAQLELLLTVTMMSRITLNLRKQALYGPATTGSASTTVYPYSRDWTHSELSSAMRKRSGSSSSAMSKTSRSMAGSSASNQRHSTEIQFARGPALYPERLALSTIFSATPTPMAVTPVAGSPGSEAIELSWEVAGSTTSHTHKDIETA